MRECLKACTRSTASKHEKLYGKTKYQNKVFKCQLRRNEFLQLYIINNKLLSFNYFDTQKFLGDNLILLHTRFPYFALSFVVLISMLKVYLIVCRRVRQEVFRNTCVYKCIKSFVIFAPRILKTHTHTNTHKHAHSTYLHT